jgi:hypothetical protein
MHKALQFISVSTDGDVVLWTLAKSELIAERIMRLLLPAGSGNGGGGGGGPEAVAAGGTSATGGAGKGTLGEACCAPRRAVGGVCMDFNWVRAARGCGSRWCSTTRAGGIKQHYRHGPL